MNEQLPEAVDETNASVDGTALPSSPQASPLAQPVFTWSVPTRVAFVFTGVVLPIICFAIGYPEGPEWQSGEWKAYAELLLSHRPTSAIYPLLAYSMTCMTMLTVAPERFVKNFVVRFGVYVGALLAVEYWGLFFLAICDSTVEVLLWAPLLSAIAVAVPWFAGWLMVFCSRKFGAGRVAAVVFLILGAITLLLVLLHGRDGAAMPFGIVFFLCLLCSTPWAVASYAAISVYAFRNSGTVRWQFNLARLMGVFTYLALHCGAWRISVEVMLREYSKLPTTPPETCYVCTAAARGHRRLVGSEPCFGATNTPHPVNDQLRRLKAAELMLAVGCPALHRAVRAVYNRIGPSIAAMLVHPLLADMAYLSLKPLEWAARIALALLLPGRGELIRDMYRGQTREHGPGAKRAHCEKSVRPTHKRIGATSGGQVQ